MLVCEAWHKKKEVSDQRGPAGEKKSKLANERCRSKRKRDVFVAEIHPLVSCRKDCTEGIEILGRAENSPTHKPGRSP